MHVGLQVAYVHTFLWILCRFLHIWLRIDNMYSCVSKVATLQVALKSFRAAQVCSQVAWLHAGSYGAVKGILFGRVQYFNTLLVFRDSYLL